MAAARWCFIYLSFFLSFGSYIGYLRYTDVQWTLPLGQVQLLSCYDSRAHILYVTILRARKLQTRRPNGDARPDPLVRCILLPGKLNHWLSQVQGYLNGGRRQLVTGYFIKKCFRILDVKTLGFRSPSGERATDTFPEFDQRSGMAPDDGVSGRDAGRTAQAPAGGHRVAPPVWRDVGVPRRIPTRFNWYQSFFFLLSWNGVWIYWYYAMFQILVLRMSNLTGTGCRIIPVGWPVYQWVQNSTVTRIKTVIIDPIPIESTQIRISNGVNSIERHWTWIHWNWIESRWELINWNEWNV